MPFLARLFVKTSFVFLVIGLFLMILSNKFPSLFPVSIHSITLGWITNMIFGVSFWMFPRVSRENLYGNTKIVFLSFALLNAGNFIRIISEPFIYKEVLKYLFILSLILQFFACLTFSIYIWKRIK
jgi:hypothetical protein